MLRVELSLKELRQGWHNLPPEMVEGSTVKGIVRRVQPFGVFVELIGTTITGMAHVSELADGYVKDPTELFKPDQGTNGSCKTLLSFVLLSVAFLACLLAFPSDHADKLEELLFLARLSPSMPHPA